MWHLWSGTAWAVTWFGGDYGGADITVADGDLLDGTFSNVGIFTVPAGAVVEVKHGVPLVMTATQIIIDGHLSANREGQDRPPFSSPGIGFGGGENGPFRVAGDGGAGYGGAGGAGGVGRCYDCGTDVALGLGGPAFGLHDDPTLAPLGSSGASNDANKGGAGGGSISLFADTIAVSADGRVTANGGDGAGAEYIWEPGAGGGSGGSVVLVAATITLDGVVTARGGAGGEGGEDASSYDWTSWGGGGGGGGGRIKVYGELFGSAASFDVAGGAGGPQVFLGPDSGWDGSPGTLFVDPWVVGPPVVSLAPSVVPWQLTLDVVGATPVGHVVVLYGDGPGADVLADGACAGVVTALASPRVGSTVTVSESGDHTQQVELEPWMQVLDVWSCTVSDLVLCPGEVAVSDVDGDGVPRGCDDCPQAYDPGQGAPFGLQVSLTPPAVYPSGVDATAVFATDLDGDGDTDVLSASGFPDDDVEWRENLGDRFGAERIISTSATGRPSSVHATDLDGDGDPDVLVASENSNQVSWHENLGGGLFGAHQLITSLAGAASSIYAADLDGDGDADVLSAAEKDDEIAWYENLGGGVFGAQHVITDLADSARSVHAADLDGDGDVDVLAASAGDDEVSWYENLDGGAFGAQQIITALADGARAVFAADLDGDGDADVLSASDKDDEVSWYENLGDGTFGAQSVIADEDGAGAVLAADLDGDGDPDIVSGGAGALAWNENLGSGAFGARRVITDRVLSVLSVHAADVDGDGDLDVLSATADDDQVAWYPNHIDEIQNGGECGCADALADADADRVCDALDVCSGLDDALFDVDGDGACAVALDGTANDCDDQVPAAHPGATEVCDGVDNSCAGFLTLEEVTDADGDGVLACSDCDDADPLRYPGAAESCDGRDNDCDAFLPADEVDVDLDGVRVCAGDCDDTDPTRYPGAAELCDGVDSACLGLSVDELDWDWDGVRTCAGDCDDHDWEAYPGAVELCDGVDNACLGLAAVEADGDLDGFMPCDGDCADADATAYPGAVELCDGVDNACVGAVAAEELDLDHDGLRGCGGDCDDADARRYEGAIEEVGDEVDSDCDGVERCFGDRDGDGYTDGEFVVGGPRDDADCADAGEFPAAFSAVDCDDTNPARHPGGSEVRGDGIDSDCDGADFPACGCRTAGPPLSSSLLLAGLLAPFLGRRRSADPWRGRPPVTRP